MPQLRNAPLALIVDDHADSAVICQAAFEANGYQTEVFDRGDTALERIVSEPRPDVVILDLALPGASGVDILNAMESKGLYNQTAVVVITANPSMISQCLYQDMGIDIRLKPVSYSVLAALAEKLKGEI